MYIKLYNLIVINRNVMHDIDFYWLNNMYTVIIDFSSHSINIPHFVKANVLSVNMSLISKQTIKIKQFTIKSLYEI